MPPPANHSGPDRLDELLAIETAEQVTLALPVAGLSSRSMAFLMDHALLIPVGIGLYLLQEAFAWLDQVGEVLSIILLASFYTLYFLGCEFWMQGQTPAKRALKLRVVDHAGHPAAPTQILIRNLMRPADLLLTALGVQLFVVFWTPRSLRLGDLVAGTLVIRESTTPLAAVEAAIQRQAFLAGTGRESGGRLGRRLSAADRDLLRRFFDRAGRLSAAERETLAARLLERLHPQIGSLATSEGLGAYERLVTLWRSLEHETSL